MISTLRDTARPRHDILRWIHTLGLKHLVLDHVSFIPEHDPYSATALLTSSTTLEVLLSVQRPNKNQIWRAAEHAGHVRNLLKRTSTLDHVVSVVSIEKRFPGLGTFAEFTHQTLRFDVVYSPHPRTISDA